MYIPKHPVACEPRLHVSTGKGDANECLHTHLKRPCLSRRVWTRCSLDNHVTCTPNPCCVICYVSIGLRRVSRQPLHAKTTTKILLYLLLIMNNWARVKVGMRVLSSIHNVMWLNVCLCQMTFVVCYRRHGSSLVYASGLPSFQPFLF